MDFFRGFGRFWGFVFFGGIWVVSFWHNLVFCWDFGGFISRFWGYFSGHGCCSVFWHFLCVCVCLPDRRWSRVVAVVKCWRRRRAACMVSLSWPMNCWAGRRTLCRHWPLASTLSWPPMSRPPTTRSKSTQSVYYYTRYYYTYGTTTCINTCTTTTTTTALRSLPSAADIYDQLTSISWLYRDVSGLHSPVGLSLLPARQSGTHSRPNFVVCLTVLMTLGAR